MLRIQLSAILLCIFPHDPVMRRLSSILLTMVMNLFGGTANETSYLPMNGRAEISNMPMTGFG
jgi:hypothetical protein